MRKIVAAAFFVMSLQALPAFAENGAAPAKDAAKAVSPTSVVRADEPNLRTGAQENSYVIKDAPLPNDYVEGKKSAPVVMIEYASLSCPHCAFFSTNVMPDIEKNYIKTGKVKYVLRQFPLNEPALKGAILVECVSEKDKSKYFLFSKVLFDAQSKWAFDGNYMSGLETIANVGGISKDDFQKCMSSTERETHVLEEKKLADTELKVPHTPYIFIGGKLYEGPHTAKDVSAAIDAKLAEIKPSNKEAK